MTVDEARAAIKAAPMCWSDRVYSADYDAKHLRQGYACGKRTDVDYAVQCKAKFDALCDQHPDLAPAWREDWARMIARARKWGW